MPSTSSFSMTGAWLRTLKHRWLFLNTLETTVAVRRPARFHVASHNAGTQHSALRGQAPGENCHGRGQRMPKQLEAAKHQAPEARVNANSARSCRLRLGERLTAEEAIAAPLARGDGADPQRSGTGFVGEAESHSRNQAHAPMDSSCRAVRRRPREIA